MIPKWLKHYLHDEDLTMVQSAVTQAESHTRGEIVPTIVRSSTTVDHVPLILFLLTFACMLMVDSVVQTLWIHPPLMGVIAGALLGIVSIPLAHVGWVQRHLTSRSDLHHGAMARAQLEFYEADISHTSGKIGVLLFLSMMERQAVVLADKTIADKLPPETWKRVIELLIAGIKRDELAHGMKDAIHAIGEIMREHFPQESHAVNEVSNELVIKD